MQVIKKIDELVACVKACKEQNKTIGLVPTMGALHAGHLSLIKKAESENNVCFVSIFVNPTQFNNKADLQTYPRDIQRDCEMLSCEKVDFVFAPSEDEIYTIEERNAVFSFDFNGLDKIMEGSHRPGHFNGVVQIVSKLFYLIQPNRAYFGEKDYQQLCIIRYMVYRSSLKNTFNDIVIESCPTIRENNGLAYSSRNSRLTDEQKEIASNIYDILRQSVTWISDTGISQNRVKIIEELVIQKINAIKGLKVEYFCIVNKDTLAPSLNFSDAIGCIAVYCGDVRLIDNIQY